MSDGPRGVFAGLATLDVVHRVERQPGGNEKVTASAQFVAAGGPAANAAVTFAALGGEATLVTALGRSPVARLIAEELAGVGVTIVDVAPDDVEPAVSSVTVLESSGDRSVVGGDAASVDVPAPADADVDAVIADARVVLLDGHHPRVALAVAAAAHRRGLPTVIDAGRWKPVFADLLPQATDVVASADFRLPGAATSAETSTALADSGMPVVVTTAGAGPVTWSSPGGVGAVDVPPVRAVDTLGAGDVFHGAYAFALAAGIDVAQRIEFACAVAATRCTMLGPRSWLDAIASIPLRQGDT